MIISPNCEHSVNCLIFRLGCPCSRSLSRWPHAKLSILLKALILLILDTSDAQDPSPRAPQGKQQPASTLGRQPTSKSFRKPQQSPSAATQGAPKAAATRVLRIRQPTPAPAITPPRAAPRRKGQPISDGWDGVLTGAFACASTCLSLCSYHQSP